MFLKVFLPCSETVSFTFELKSVYVPNNTGVCLNITQTKRKLMDNF
jgi:hypothetical protein